MNIKKLASILFILLSMTVFSRGQIISDIQQLELEDGLLDRIVNKVHRDTFGYFYLFFDQGIQQYDGKNFLKVNSVQLNNVDLRLVSHVSRSKEGGIYFEINKNGFLIPPGQTIAKPYTKKKVIPEITSNIGSIGFTSNKENFIAERGGIWSTKNGTKKMVFGTETNGLDCHLLKTDLEGNRLALFGYRNQTTELIILIRNDGTYENYNPILEYNNNIKDIYFDDVDAKWLVATFNGIYIYNFSSQGIENFHVLPNVKKSQFGHIITAITTAEDRVLFLKETYGLREIDKEGNVNLLFEEKPQYFQQNQKIIYDEYLKEFYSYSYASSGDYELHRFNINKNEVKVDYIPTRIRDLYNLNSEYLIIAGDNKKNKTDETPGSLFKYKKADQTLVKLHGNLPPMRNINFIKETNEFWIGTKNGIIIYDSDFNFKESLNRNVNKGEKYISHPDIRTMLELDHEVLVGSYTGGVYLIDKNSKNVLRNISEYNGLSDNAIAGIIQDNMKNIWISTFNGLTILNEQLQIIQKIYEYEGLPNREFNTKATAKDKDGNLFFGTLNGLVKINPSQVLNKKTSQGLHLSQMAVFHNDSRQIFYELDDFINTYNNYDSINLDINYPDYYKYRFDNWSSSLKIDKSLNEIIRIKNNKISIAKLPIGQHTIKFNNTTNPHSQSLKLHVTRDMRKILGIIAFIAATLGLILIFFKYRIDQLKKFEAEKTRINTKIAELELTALRSQMNPHFIFNALGSVQYFIQTQETEKADSYLSNFAKLMRKILESSKSKMISLQEEIQLLDLYVGLEKMRFEKMFDFKLMVDEEIDLENPIPPMVIQPFVENAINHGLYHLTNRKGVLNIHFKYIDEFKMQCIINDNGIGRKIANQRQKPKHKSRGLEIVKDRVQTINSQSEIKLNIRTLDLHNGENATGTQVIIDIEYEE